MAITMSEAAFPKHRAPFLQEPGFVRVDTGLVVGYDVVDRHPLALPQRLDRAEAVKGCRQSLSHLRQDIYIRLAEGIGPRTVDGQCALGEWDVDDTANGTLK